MLRLSRFAPLRRIRAALILGTIFLVVTFLRGSPSVLAARRHVIPADGALGIDASSLRVPSSNVAHQGSKDSPAERLCRQLGWQPFVPRANGISRRRKVYDLFMVSTELDWLEVRLNTTYDYVDYFVIVESRRTFTAKDKPLVIRENWRLLEPYAAKIIYHELEYPPDFRPHLTWELEDLQRNAMLEQVFPTLTGDQKPQDGDAIVVADVDEILRPATLAALRHCDFPRRLTLRSRFYYYSFQFLHKGQEWAHPQATFYEGPDHTVRPVNLRNGDGAPAPLVWREKADLWNAGWHCSSCFRTMDELLTKMASFSHMLLNKEKYRDRDRIAERVRAGRDLWDRKTEQYTRLENNTDMPSAVMAQRERFTYLWDRSGPSAGFQDYPP